MRRRYRESFSRRRDAPVPSVALPSASMVDGAFVRILRDFAKSVPGSPARIVLSKVAYARLERAKIVFEQPTTKLPLEGGVR